MNPQSAKLATLEQLIGLMDDRMLGKLKRRGQPEPEAAAAPTEEPTPEAPIADSEAEDTGDLQQLMDMYGKETSAE